ncbi:MAG: NAD(P)-dependent oxidoreductase [Roseiarcus sp.]|jgi:nucleoside-diphosphate-sugar epimerase
MEGQVVLVTGAAGLVGNAIRLRLERRGTTVLPIDRVAHTRDGNATLVCDVNDVHRLHALAAEYSISGVVHCGAYSGPMVARDNPTSMIRVNIVGTANILELARIHHVPRVVFCSSASVYGNTDGGPVPEDVPLFPTSLYGASKVASEQLVASYARQYGVDGVSIRLSWIYGPWRTTDCVIRTMIEDALEERPTNMPFGRDFHRQFIHVDDAVDALIAALDTPNLPRLAYTVTGGSYVTLAEVADIVRRVLPQANIHLESGAAPLDDVQQEFDISAAARDFGFRPAISLEEGIRRYAEWLIARKARVAA